jgi:hypothetical protein
MRPSSLRNLAVSVVVIGEVVEALVDGVIIE